MLLTGWVYKTYVSRNKNECVFDLMEQKKNMVLKCYTESFFPVWEGDVIAGMATANQSGYIFTNNPVVKLNISEDEIIKCIIKSQKGSIRKDFAKKVYDSIVIYNESTNVDNILNNMAIDFMENQSDDLVPLKEYISDSQAKKLLKWWYKTRVLRKLYLLGLTNRDIKDSKMRPDELYEQCLVDSFIVVSIPIDKCKKIYSIMFKQYTEDQLFRATVARKLYHNTINNAWVGTPSKYLESSFKDVDKKSISTHMDALRKDYGIKTELFTVYLKEQYEAEKMASDIITSLIKNNGNKEMLNDFYRDLLIKMNKPDPNATYNIEYHKDSLNDAQKKAVNNALCSKFSIITGGAGTGKTTVIAELVHNLDLLGIPYIVASYTGKAVARIKEVIKKNSPMTIHMMLSRSKTITPFRFAIFDESSMITTDLMHMFWKAFGTNFSLCFIGDNNQLPPISCGNFFDQIIKSGIVEPLVLTKNHRTLDVKDHPNDIVFNAESLINYIKAEVDPDEFREPFRFRTGSNFHMLNGNEQTVYKCIEMLASNGISPNDITVITPYTKNLDDLNRNIQKIFAINEKHYMDSKGIKWSIGDRVMVTQNNYSLGQMNGDEGTIIDMTDAPGESGYQEMMVEFRSGHSFKFVMTYEKNGVENFSEIGFENYIIINDPTLDILTHCYAITIHKSQGSEWDYVIFYLPKNESGTTNFVNKHLIYTADTRARKGIWNIGDMQSLELHATMKPGFRHDTLAQRLKIAFN
jgi:hypothetical protein